EYSSCTTASVESVAAPSRSRAASASDLPAPIPPVRPTKGSRGGGSAGPAIGGLSRCSLLGRGGVVLGSGLRRGDGRLGLGGGLGLVGRRGGGRFGGGLCLGGRGLRRRLGGGLWGGADRVDAREDVLAQAELGHVVERCGLLRRQRPAR